MSLFTKIINGISLLTYFILNPIEDSIEEVTADHPKVLSVVKETIQMTKGMNFEQPYEKHAEILEEVLQTVSDPGCSFLSFIEQ